jgi:hypothetical protein
MPERQRPAAMRQPRLGLLESARFPGAPARRVPGKTYLRGSPVQSLASLDWPLLCVDRGA